MKIVCRKRREENIWEFIIVENIKSGYEITLLEPLIKSNTDVGIEYLLVSDDFKLYKNTPDNK